MFDSPFDAVDFAGLRLRNRFALAPMTRVSAEANGRANAAMVDHYVRYAKGGFGLLITEGIYPDQAASQGYAYQPGLADALQTESWVPIVKAVHAADSKIIAQIMHAGAQLQYNRYVDQPIGLTEQKPMAKPLGLYGDQEAWFEPKPMTETDFDQVMNGFLGAIRNAQAAGFDGVELHGANGYLLNQMLSTHFNTREDKFGGSLEKRAKFILDLVKSAREMVDNDFALGIRLSQITITDQDYQWPEGEEGFAWLVQALTDAGIDFIHTTDTSADRASLRDGDRSLAEVVQDTGVALIVNGGINDENYQDVANSYPDALLALGKAALADPAFVRKIQGGEPVDALDFAMLQPIANVENEMRWRADQKD
ncbi:NADH:flavin oxidoreductase [Pseudidiomarina sp. YC-516-91]|uniref:oxidoreductase n=1 Tax=Pseudidiomarina salilacus TaxID=3384452 RepID=UPI0039848273